MSDYDDFLDGLGLLLAANIRLGDVGPIVLGTQGHIDLAKAVTGITSDKTKSANPPALTMPFLPTTSCRSGSPLTSTAFMADWRDLLFGVRRDITGRVLTEARMASNVQLAVVAYARVDFQPARTQRRCEPSSAGSAVRVSSGARAHAQDPQRALRSPPSPRR